MEYMFPLITQKISGLVSVEMKLVVPDMHLAEAVMEHKAQIGLLYTSVSISLL